METRIEKMSLETLGAVERVCFTNGYVNCLLKQAYFNHTQNYENGINKFNRDSEKKHNMFMFCFCYLFCVA